MLPVKMSADDIAIAAYNTISPMCVCEYQMAYVKGYRLSDTRYRAFGPELIPV